MEHEIFLKDTFSTISNSCSSSCPLCLKVPLNRNNYHGSDGSHSSVLFEEFINFSKVYLKVNTGEKFFLVDQCQLPVFCELCEGKVKEMLELHLELKKLKFKLLWKVMTVGEIISKSQARKMEAGQPSGDPRLIDHSVKRIILQMFRKKVEQSCRFISRKILPVVRIEKSDGRGRSPGTFSDAVAAVVEQRRPDQRLQTSPGEVQCLIGLILVYALVYGWNLSSIVNSCCPPPTKTAAFVKVAAEFRSILIPSRQTFRTFISTILIYSLAYGWSLFGPIIRLCSQCTSIEAPPSTPQIMNPLDSNVKIQDTSVISLARLLPPPNNVLKRKSSRPPYSERKAKLKKRSSRRGKRKKNIKPVNLKAAKRRPRNVKLQAGEGKDGTNLENKQEDKIQLVEILVEKAEVDNPTPEPLLVDLGFQDNNEEPFEDHFYGMNSPFDQDVHLSPPMDKVTEEISVGPEFFKEEEVTISGNLTEDDELPVSPLSKKSQNQKSHETSSGPSTDNLKQNMEKLVETPDVKTEMDAGTTELFKVKRRPGGPSKSCIVKAESESATTQHNVDNSKKKKRDQPPRRKTVSKVSKCEQFDEVKSSKRRPGRPKKKKSSQKMSKPVLSPTFSIKCTHSACSQTFDSLLPFHEHLRSVHSTTTAEEGTSHHNHLRCSSCEETFESELSLMLHLQKDHENPEENDALHFCLYCRQSFRTAQLEQLHRKDVHWLYPQKVFCEVKQCSEEFTCTKQLSEHYTTFHGPTSSDKNPSSNADLVLFSCDQCHWPFLTKTLLRLHRFNHMESTGKYDDDGYQCPMCPNRYPDGIRLADHFNRVREPYHVTKTSKLSSWGCTISFCGFAFFSEKEWKAHEKLHEQYKLRCTYPKETSTNREFNAWTQYARCIYCLERFPATKIRNEHEATCASGPSPEQKLKMSTAYACAKCNFVTDNRQKFCRHSVTHSDASYVCSECGSKFGRRDHLREHVKRKHSNPEEMFVCHLCGVRKATKTDINYHISEHERKHLCPECGYRCSRASLLSLHMRKHTGEKIQCEWCPTFFETVPQLKRHYESGHPENFQRMYGGKMKTRVAYKLAKNENA